MCTEEQLLRYKNIFIGLVNSIERDFDKETLIKRLEESDFFIAPASTKYHNAFKGGLLDHSLNVYNNLKSLVEMCHLEPVYSADSIKIVSLFHDIAKINFYEEYYANKKVYSEYGTKRDNLGLFDWESVKAYKVRDFDDRFVYGNHEQNSEYLISRFIPLTTEESVAILHHHGGVGDDSIKSSISEIYTRYPLACLLHQADMISAYVLEKQ